MKRLGFSGLLVSYLLQRDSKGIQLVATLRLKFIEAHLVLLELEVSQEILAPLK